MTGVPLMCAIAMIVVIWVVVTANQEQRAAELGCSKQHEPDVCAYFLR